MRNHAKISQVAHYLPKKIVTNDDLAQRMETSDEWIRSVQVSVNDTLLLERRRVIWLVKWLENY